MYIFYSSQHFYFHMKALKAPLEVNSQASPRQLQISSSWQFSVLRTKFHERLLTWTCVPIHVAKNSIFSYSVVCVILLVCLDLLFFFCVSSPLVQQPWLGALHSFSFYRICWQDGSWVPPESHQLSQLGSLPRQRERSVILWKQACRGRWMDRIKDW